MAFPIHPHMLRDGCGYALANAGHDTRSIQAWMGHKKHPAHHPPPQATTRWRGFAKLIPTASPDQERQPAGF